MAVRKKLDKTKFYTRGNSYGNYKKDFQRKKGINRYSGNSRIIGNRAYVPWNPAFIPWQGDLGNNPCRDCS